MIPASLTSMRRVAPMKGAYRGEVVNRATEPGVLSGHRIEGLDLARGIAILGMVLVNFSIDANEENSAVWLSFILDVIQGRAAATFVVLAGVGVSLLARRARLLQRPDLLHRVRLTLLKRAVFLLLAGIALLPLWPADILHFYAVYLSAAILFLTVPDRALWTSAGTFVATFVIMFFVFDYSEGWNSDTEYVYMWSATLRRLWFDGYYPLFPWMAFILVGMWLGRQDLDDHRKLTRFLILALCVGATLQFFSWYVLRHSSVEELDSPIRPLALLGTSPYPPGPIYMATSACFAVAVIVSSLEVTRMFPQNLLVRMFVASGQLALSIYVLHATLGFLILDSLLDTMGDSLNVAAATAAVFCLVSLTFAFVWRRELERGPLETIMRRLTAS